MSCNFMSCNFTSCIFSAPVSVSFVQTRFKTLIRWNRWNRWCCGVKRQPEFPPSHTLISHGDFYKAECSIVMSPGDGLRPISDSCYSKTAVAEYEVFPMHRPLRSLRVLMRDSAACNGDRYFQVHTLRNVLFYL